ncbi:MAG: hypothetical protein KA319_00335 [Ferruginibacter sp.]|nr:hypothetical protein [Ferruginibacter sp.]
MKLKTTIQIFISILVLCILVTSCKKGNDLKSKNLTNSFWRFYVLPPNNTTILFPTNAYSVYHVPPNIGYSSFGGHTIQFMNNGKLLYSTQNSNAYNNWILIGDNIYVTKHYSSNTFNEIWNIQTLNDTLLNVKIRNSSEPENTENYWGYKYYKF